MELIDAFEWSKCDGGYELQRHGTAIAARGHRFSTYLPLKLPNLFAMFANCDATPEGMRAFCGTFGLPTGSIGNIMRTIASGRKVVTRFHSADVATLLQHQARMKQGLRLLKSGDHSQLTNFINWSDGLVLSMQVQLGPDGKPWLCLVPPNLLAAMWYQLIQHACSGRKLIECRHCGKPIVVGPGTWPPRRSTSMYCDDRCRVAAHNALRPTSKKPVRTRPHRRRRAARR